MNYKLNTEQDWLELARQANWSVAALARLGGICTRTLERHFNERYQQSPENWLAEQRWRLVLELLLEGASHKNVHSEAGYQHLSTFTREFKKRFGQAPAAFVRAMDARQMPSANHNVAKN